MLVFVKDAGRYCCFQEPHSGHKGKGEDSNPISKLWGSALPPVELKLENV